MTRKKARATVLVADGSGGTLPLQDQRFDGGTWPFSFQVPAPDADTWLEYFSTECARRKWSCSGIGQLEPKENSGTIIVRAESSPTPLIDIVWNRTRDGPLGVRVRAGDGSTLSEEQISGLLDRVTSQCHAGVREQFYRRGQLIYDGRAWRGEIWLSGALRLGPPFSHDETAVFGPR